MLVTPQLAFPLTWDSVEGFALVTQDTRSEMEARADITLRCPQGWLDKPNDDFGLPPLEFIRGDPGQAVRDVLARWQPGIPTEVVEQQVDLVTAAVAATVGAGANG